MGFNLGFLGPALTTATQAEGQVQEGNAQRQQATTQGLVQALLLKKQMDQENMMNMVHAAYIQNLQSEPAYRQGMLNAANTRANAEVTRANRPIAPRPIQFVPGATPGTHVDPNSPTGVSVMPGITAKPDANSPAVTSERERQMGWRRAFGSNLQHLTAPQVNPLTGLKTAGISLAQALPQDSAMTTAAWGPAPGASSVRSPAPSPAPKGPTATAADSAVAKIAAQRIATGKATLQQALASPSLSPAVKQLLQSGYTGTP